MNALAGVSWYDDTDSIGLIALIVTFVVLFVAGKIHPKC